MSSDERNWPSRPTQRQPSHSHFQHPAPPPRPYTPEDTLALRALEVERKSIRLTLKENARGRFIRITEGDAGRVNSIIIPVSGLKDFQKLVAELVASADVQRPLA